MGSQNLNASYLVSQGYDGASAMSGNTTVCRLLYVAIAALHYMSIVHYASHCLNLKLSHSCDQQSIRNATGVIQQTANYFRCKLKFKFLVRIADMSSRDSSDRPQQATEIHQTLLKTTTTSCENSPRQCYGSP